MQSEEQISTGADDWPQDNTPPCVAAWPSCPGCGRPRHTACPVCGTAGGDFPRADEEFFDDGKTDSTDGLPLICPTCDEPFVAQFLWRCQWCGHDFGNGLQVDVGATSGEDVEPLNGRALAVAIALVGVVVLAVVYLTFITGH